MNTLYTKEEREEKLRNLEEGIRELNHEELVALNKLIDKLMADYQKQAREPQAEG